MIELREVTKEYSKGVAALNGINLKIEQGEFVFIVDYSIEPEEMWLLLSIQ